MNKKKILILTPDLDSRGGISNYFKILQPFLPNNIQYFTRGARFAGNRQKENFQTARILIDYLKFTLKILLHNVKLVQVTTSLGNKSVKRDGIFILISKLLGKKVIVFFRGWSKDRENEIMEKSFPFFNYCFKKANGYIILANEVEETLKKWDFKGPFYKETTIVDDTLLNNTNEKSIREKFLQTTNFQCLFLARMEKYKGVEEAIEALSLAQSDRLPVVPVFAGEGSFYTQAKKLAKKHRLSQFKFTGHVNGEERIQILASSHVYIFPSYNEGMPNSVLEAMGAGLIIITTNVGAIKDFFIPGKMGFLIEVKNPENLFNAIRKVVGLEKRKLAEIGINNFLYAKMNYSPETVSARLINIYNTYLG